MVKVAHQDTQRQKVLSRQDANITPKRSCVNIMQKRRSAQCLGSELCLHIGEVNFRINHDKLIQSRALEVT